MIDGLRPYAEMKPSRLPWLGEVPAHWDIRRIKTLLREVDSRSKTGEERLLSLRMRQGLIDHIDAGGKLIPPESLVNFKIVEPGQVVMNRMRAAVGLFGVASVRGLVSPDYAVFEPKPEAFNPYLLQAFRLPSLSAVFRAESKGLGTGESGFLRLYTDRFGPIPVPYPPLDEQRSIVRFLDWHGAQTAKLIRAKKKIIALLNEQKQAIIHRAVTRGLDPNVRLKPSGIPWLGDVPEGWEVLPCRALFAEVREREAPQEELLSVTIRNGVIPQKQLLENSSKKDSSNLDKTKYKLVLPGDIAYNKMRAWQGAFGASAYRGIISPAYVVQRPRAGALSQYYHYLLRTPSFAKEAEKWSYGIVSDMWSLRPEHFRLIYCPKPPEAEQKAICEHLEIATRDIVCAIHTVEREIALIQEFRTRLTADAVIGKLDVRAASASLPDTAEPEAIGDLTEDDDLESPVDDVEDEEVAA